MPAARAAMPASFPAAGTLTGPNLVVRAAPDPHASRIAVLREFRSDFRPQIVLAVDTVRGKLGRSWYKIALAMRPNGRFGYVPAGGVDLQPVAKRIVIDRGARTLSVYRGGTLLFRTKVAVGAPGTPTPRGNFYVTAEFRSSNPFYGDWAIETSAYSPTLTEWPGGGIVGIHGTSQPWLLGQAVSHGCVRVSNPGVRRLKELVPLGTPISVVG